MIKVLGLLTFIISLQTAMANDFLRSGKQLLVCEKEEILFRINWEDWDVENKSFGVRSRNKLVKFVLSIDREDRENTYKIDSDTSLIAGEGMHPQQKPMRFCDLRGCPGYSCH